jgi:hypothetical protein
MYSRKFELKDEGRVSAATRGHLGGLYYENSFAPFIWWNGP